MLPDSIVGQLLAAFSITSAVVASPLSSLEPRWGEKISPKVFIIDMVSTHLLLASE